MTVNEQCTILQVSEALDKALLGLSTAFDELDADRSNKFKTSVEIARVQEIALFLRTEAKTIAKEQP